jgi:hypothetical protein
LKGQKTIASILLSISICFSMKAKCLLLTLMTILSAGCATNNGVIVSARHDAHFSPTRTDKISMALRPNPSAEDAALGSILQAELKSEGFDIVTNADADYALACLVEDDSTVETYWHHELVASPNPYVVTLPPQTTGDRIVQDLTGQRQREFGETVTVPVAVTVQRKGIRLYLYTNPKTHPGGLQIAWQGCIEAGKTIPAGRELVLIRTLLGYFGQDYVGRVTLPQ